MFFNQLPNLTLDFNYFSGLHFEMSALNTPLQQVFINPLGIFGLPLRQPGLTLLTNVTNNNPYTLLFENLIRPFESKYELSGSSVSLYTIISQDKFSNLYLLDIFNSLTFNLQP